MRQRQKQLGVEEAEAIAINGLSFLALEPERIGQFLAASGLGPADLRAAAAEPEFLASVLEFLLQDESLLLVFASERAIEPGMIKPAMYCLRGEQGG